ncbi:hypothetical protein H8D29_01505, partial [PVC group bacterium]|nr:hypothetical protein [PVC group bacterium]
IDVFRGDGVEGDNKALTFRLRFRDKQRNLTHEEVDSLSSKAIDSLVENFEAEIRS